MTVDGRSTGRRRSAFAVLVITVAVVALTGCDWSQLRAGPAGTGYNAGESTIGPGNVATLVARWSRGVSWEVPGSASPSPLARLGDTLVVASPGHSRVLDAETGAVRRAIGGPRDRAVAIDGARVIITGAAPTPGSLVSSYDLASAAPQWASDAEFAATAPVVADGIVYVNSEGTVGTHPGILWAYRESDGHKLWDVGGCCNTNAPGVANGTMYFTQDRQGAPNLLDAVDAKTGAPKWSVPAPTQCTFKTSPVISGGKLYVSGATFDAATGAHLWDWPVCPAWYVTTVSPTTVYVPYRPTPTTSALEAFDASTGAVRWSIPWGENATGAPSAPAVANGVLFAADGNRLIAADAATGTRLWRSKASTGIYDDPIVANGSVDVMNTDGRVRAFALPSS